MRRSVAARLSAAGKPPVRVSAVYEGHELDFACLNGAGEKVMTVSAGKGKNAGPMQLVLYAVATCAMTDTVSILAKQRVSHRPELFRCDVTAARSEEGARPYQTIHMDFSIVGNEADAEKFARAVSLSVEKYCGVHATLHGGPAKITFETRVIPDKQ